MSRSPTLDLPKSSIASPCSRCVYFIFPLAGMLSECDGRRCVGRQVTSRQKSSIRRKPIRGMISSSTAGPSASSSFPCAPPFFLLDLFCGADPQYRRLTNTGPFIEDENEPDMRRRIAERYIDWGTLRYKHVSPPGTLSFCTTASHVIDDTRDWLQHRTSFAVCLTLIHRLA